MCGEGGWGWEEREKYQSVKDQLLSKAEVETTPPGFFLPNFVDMLFIN